MPAAFHKSFNPYKSLIVLAVLITVSVVQFSPVSRAADWSGLKIKNFGRMDEHFYRGAQPKRVEYRELASAGVKTVIDLRDDPEHWAKAAAEEASLHYVNIPLSDSHRPSDEQITEFFSVAGHTDQPFFVHCEGGRHRTGVMGALYRMKLQGWSADQAYEEMKQYKFYTRWGHGEMKEFVFDYYQGMHKSGTAAAIPSPDEIKTR